MNKIKNTRLIIISFICVIILLLSFTPIGFISIGPVRATVIHIPVVVGAILLGPYVGAFLGGFFGLVSLMINTFIPTVTSFVFSPFYSLGDISGNFWSLVICFIPRILLGFLAWYIYKIINKFISNKKISISIAAVLSSLVHTFLVMIGIYVFFGQEYAIAKQVDFSDIFNVIMVLITTNGVLESILAGLVCAVIISPLQKYSKLTY